MTKAILMFRRHDTSVHVIVASHNDNKNKLLLSGIDDSVACAEYILIIH